MVAMTPSEPPTDAALARAWRAGDEGAAAEIVRRHAGAVARFLYSAGAGRSDVDDLVQEALFRAFRKLDTWRGVASLTTLPASFLLLKYPRGKVEGNGRQ